MGRKTTIKWEKSTLCKPVHNIISSDFPKYVPQPWKFMEGCERMEYVISNEYQRMWMEELAAWKKRMYPENTTVNVDVVKNYVLTFKTQMINRKEKLGKKERKSKISKPKKQEHTEKPA